MAALKRDRSAYQRTRQILRRASHRILEEKGISLANHCQDIITEQANVHQGEPSIPNKYALVGRDHREVLAPAAKHAPSYGDRNTTCPS